MLVRSSVFLFDCGAGCLERRHRSKTRVPRATVGNARIDAIGTGTNAVVVAEIGIATSAVVAAKIAIEIGTAIVTATNANRAKPPKKPVMPNRRLSKRHVATRVAVATAPAAKAVAVKVKVRVRDVAAVGMISVVVNHAVTTAVSVRLPRLPHPLLPLPHRLRHRSRRQRRLRPSRAVQTSSRRFWMHRCRAPKAQWPVNARAALGAAVAVAVAAVGVDVIGRPAPPAR